MRYLKNLKKEIKIKTWCHFVVVIVYVLAINNYFLGSIQYYATCCCKPCLIWQNSWFEISAVHDIRSERYKQEIDFLGSNRLLHSNGRRSKIYHCLIDGITMKTCPEYSIKSVYQLIYENIKHYQERECVFFLGIRRWK